MLGYIGSPVRDALLSTCVIVAIVRLTLTISVDKGGAAGLSVIPCCGTGAGPWLLRMLVALGA